MSTSEKQVAMPGSPQAQMGVLERVRSLVEENTPVLGTEPVAGGATMPESQPYVHHFAFKRLAEERDLPSKPHFWAML